MKWIVRENENINNTPSLEFLDNYNLKDDIKTFAIKGRIQLLECIACSIRGTPYRIRKIVNSVQSHRTLSPYFERLHAS